MTPAESLLRTLHDLSHEDIISRALKYTIIDIAIINTTNPNNHGTRLPPVAHR